MATHAVYLGRFGVLWDHGMVIVWDRRGAGRPRVGTNHDAFNERIADYSTGTLSNHASPGATQPASLPRSSRLSSPVFDSPQRSC